MEKLLTLKEVKNILNIKTYATLKNKQLPIIDLDGTKRIKQSDLENYINSHISKK